MQKIISLVWIVLMATGCSTTRTNSEMTVGMVRYDAFESINVPSADTLYYVITNDAAFDQLFRSVVDKPVRPNFEGQTAVAVQAPNGSLIIIERITIQGHFMNVYAISCKPEQVECAPNGLTIATAPRSGNVSMVRFFINGVQQKEVKS